MDFILSLTHFCEVHGPTSILCSQVIPSSCTQCYSDSSDFSPNETPLSSNHASSPLVQNQGSDRASKSPQQPITPQEPEPPVSTSLRGYSTATNLEPLASPTPSAPASASCQRIEDHPWFMGGQFGRTDTEKLNRFGGADGDTCASCSLTVPEDVSKQLPPGAPGTLKKDGKSRNGSPVLRSREVVYSCSGTHLEHDDDIHESRLHHYSSPASLQSSYSSDSSCHQHLVTYLSLRGPPNPADYALLRRASIRTLSCELLPRGLSSGPLSFGDAVTGYTIAYVFRLPDPMARGKRRSYALVALAGKDAGRAFRACPVIWRVFGRIANGIVNAAERFQEQEKRREAGSVSGQSGSRNYTPVSSFLTGRTVDPDGQPRRAGQIRARNLGEIIGNEYIFAELHAQFVALLQQLGSMFGGFRPVEERPASSQSEEDEDVSSSPRATIPVRRTGGMPNHSRTGSGLSDEPGVVLSAVPRPIPISHRRQIVA